ncbi:MAG: hypothetical protein HY271_05495 [Deltaproteobacteria bacterium]|nr:hypothetical protein [Deltaproteobacteria bacterium]
MIFSFTWQRTSRRRRLGGVVLVVIVGCARAGDAPGSATRPPSTPTPAAAAGAAEVIGALKLVRQEYANAVPPAGGTVADATEYAETELFAEQAESKFASLAATAATSGAPDATRTAAIRDGLARTRAAIARHAPPAEVASEASRTLARVEELLAGAVPEEIRGAVLATARADEAVAAEVVVGEYRVGVASGPARPIFHRRGGELVAAAPDPSAVYLAVLLRERRTKRFLPAAQVTATLDQEGRRSEIALSELWGDFHQYGANVALPGEGAVTITVHASPPAYARHGDMLTHFVTPVTATIAAYVQQGALRFDAHPVQPPDADYAIGDDVLQARTEAGTLVDAGPYRIGLIVEGPEPIWTWSDGAPVLAPVAADATNHVEVALLDRDTGQLVPDARVDLTFLAGTRPVGTVSLYPLLSIFSHYGATLALPPGVTDVRIHVDPPALGCVDRSRLDRPAEVEVPLPPRRGANT